MRGISSYKTTNEGDSGRSRRHPPPLCEETSGRDLIDQRSNIAGKHFFNEAGCALDSCRLDQVGLGQFAPGGALGTDGDRTAEPDGLHQLPDGRGVRELEIGLSPVSQTDTEAPAATPIAATVHA
jgi:hypothetical protein